MKKNPWRCKYLVRRIWLIWRCLNEEIEKGILIAAIKTGEYFISISVYVCLTRLKKIRWSEGCPERFPERSETTLTLIRVAASGLKTLVFMIINFTISLICNLVCIVYELSLYCAARNSFSMDLEFRLQVWTCWKGVLSGTFIVTSTPTPTSSWGTKRKC